MGPGNTVTVFERAARAGGAFRLAGKAPLFQEVEASQASFDRYVDHLVRACQGHGVSFRFRTDPFADPALMAGFDRIVIATGAAYRFGLQWIVAPLLDAGAGQWPLLRNWLSADAFRNWFYFSARTATGARHAGRLRVNAKIEVIGDALRAGKSKDAVASAFAAAWGQPLRSAATINSPAAPRA